jgi:hypothetical protein
VISYFFTPLMIAVSPVLRKWVEVKTAIEVFALLITRYVVFLADPDEEKVPHSCR